MVVELGSGRLRVEEDMGEEVAKVFGAMWAERWRRKRPNGRESRSFWGALSVQKVKDVVGGKEERKIESRLYGETFL